MRNSYYLFFLLTILFIQSISCSNKNGDEKSESDQIELLKTEWCPLYTQTILNGVEVCNCKSVVYFPQDPESYIKEQCLKKIDSIKDNIINKKLTVNKDAISDCIQMLKIYVDKCILPLPEIFNVRCQLFLSDVSTGKSCENALCDNGNGICINGKCESLPIDGQNCLYGHCSNGLICNSDNICKQPLKTEESCKTDKDCADTNFCIDNICTEVDKGYFYKNCTNDSECLYNSSCIISEKRICQPLRDENESCTYSECGNELYCDDSTKTCKKLPAEGEECANGIMCSNGYGCDIADNKCKIAPDINQSCLYGMYGQTICKDGLVCVEQICREPPQENEKCGLNKIGEPVCSEKLGCFFENNGDNICKKKAMSGENCTNDTNCSDTDYCNFEEMKCNSRKLIDEICQYENECAKGLYCKIIEAGKPKLCKPIPEQDMECTTICKDGLMCKSRSDTGVCAPQLCTNIIKD